VTRGASSMHSSSRYRKWPVRRHDRPNYVDLQRRSDDDLRYTCGWRWGSLLCSDKTKTPAQGFIN